MVNASSACTAETGANCKTSAVKIAPLSVNNLLPLIFIIASFVIINGREHDCSSKVNSKRNERKGRYMRKAKKYPSVSKARIVVRL